MRKIDAERATWIARLRDDAGRQAYHSIGYTTDALDFDAAKAPAEAWFKTRESGVTGEPPNRDDPMVGPLVALRRGQLIADEPQHCEQDVAIVVAELRIDAASPAGQALHEQAAAASHAPGTARSRC